MALVAALRRAADIHAVERWEFGWSDNHQRLLYAVTFRFAHRDDAAFVMAAFGAQP